MAKAAVTALRLLRERCARSIATEELCKVVDLKQATQVSFRTVNVCENVTRQERLEYQIDRAPVRQLARQELIRRGLEV
jgi:hypothetical protein